jgi:hypothetical protein
MPPNARRHVSESRNQESFPDERGLLSSNDRSPFILKLCSSLFVHLLNGSSSRPHRTCRGCNSQTAKLYSRLFSLVFLRSKLAAIGAGLYLLVFICALLYPLFDRRMLSGLFAVMLIWPWTDFLPTGWPYSVGVACGLLNAIIIYVLLAALSRVFRRVRASAKSKLRSRVS